MKSVLFAVFLSFALVACSRKPELAGPQRHYQLSGKVVAVDANHQTATIDAAAIPGFMDAMSMEYPIASKEDFNTLHVGDSIKATVNVNATGDDYNLSGVQKQNASK